MLHAVLLNIEAVDSIRNILLCKIAEYYSQVECHSCALGHWSISGSW